MSIKTTAGKFTSLSLASALLTGALFIGANGAPAGASSHREAPLISTDPNADNTDTYAFVSPDRQDSVTLIGSWIPLESPEGGPNYYSFGDDVLYSINVDNIGDGKAHISYQFQFKTITTNPNTFLYNTGPITSLTDPDWNVRQYYTVTEVISDGVSTTTNVLFSNRTVPPVNIGDKSTPNFPNLSDAGIYSTGSGSSEIKVFAGQTDDAFWVDLGSIFDLLSLRGQLPPIGYPPPKGPSVGLDGVAGYNVHSIAIQVPITRVLQGATAGETVIGVWAASSRFSTRVLAPLGGVTSSGDQIQVSRLGMPLVNEAVIPLALKDAFNGLKPEQDLSVYLSSPVLRKSIEDPELGNLLCGLYNVKLPKDANNDCKTDYTDGTPRSGRADIFDIFLTGFSTGQPFTITTGGVGGTPTPLALPTGFTVTKQINAQPAEMIRLNTAIKGNLCHPTPQRLGILAGDACGFPNGRRLADDATEIELLAVAGAAWQPITGDTSFSFNPALINVLTDSVDRNDKPFRATFPYLAYAHQGQEHVHPYIVRNIFPIIPRNSGTTGN